VSIAGELKEPRSEVRLEFKSKDVSGPPLGGGGSETSLVVVEELGPSGEVSVSADKTARLRAGTATLEVIISHRRTIQNGVDDLGGVATSAVTLPRMEVEVIP
jgi:hypothetical protein